MSSETETLWLSELPKKIILLFLCLAFVVTCHFFEKPQLFLIFYHRYFRYRLSGLILIHTDKKAHPPAAY